MPGRVASHPVAIATTPVRSASSVRSGTTPQPARAWTPGTSAVRARPVDGNAFCAKTLGDIAARVSRGEKVKVVFDIDNTISDGRTRTLAIGKAWDQKNGTQYFSKVPLAKIGHDAGDTGATLKLPPAAQASFKAFWDVVFWKPESFVHDAPIAEVVALAKAAKRAGAEIIYLTGRTQALEHASIAQLKRFGLPDVDDRHVVSKPTIKTRTTEWRTAWLQSHQPEGTAFFFTESRRDVGAAQALLPNLNCVLLKSQFNGDTPVRADTPLFRP